MKLFKIFTLTLFAASGSLWANFAHASDPSLVADGAKLYSENCGRCHNPIPASSYSKNEWSVIIPHMREKAHMTGRESLAVETFLASTLTADVRNDKQVSNENVPQKSGEILITQFGCQGCHQIKGSGGNLGPSLDGVVEDKGQAFVLKKLKNPKFNNASSAMPQYPMSVQDMKTIIEYISKN